MTLRGINVADAREWAAYIRALRTEIAERKATGELPQDMAAPELMHRLLLDVLAAIDNLRSNRRTATLELPSGRALLVFAWYNASVQEWADKRVRDGILQTERSEGASRFWAVIEKTTGLPRSPVAAAT